MFKQVYHLIIISTLFLTAFVLAGTFTPNPASPDSSFYTLSDIYNKISSSTFSGVDEGSHSFNPTENPNSTFTTLSSIWDSIQWPSLNNFGTIDAGFYATSSLAEAEPNLIAGNIATGTSVFGVEGSCNGPCDGKVIGESVDGGALCAGTFSGYKYMTTPGGCTDSPTPSCDGGMDSLRKTWGTSGIETGIKNVNNGAINTLSLATTYGDSYAAKYCQDMIYSNYDDWFLPVINDYYYVLYPNMEILGGFQKGPGQNYWSSQEGDAAPNINARYYNFMYPPIYGDQYYKTQNYLIRCVRRY
jgi:hypothetical protein